ncbi:MAG: HAMP domain-containing histidine kinase, partial [Myxococcales bacterium]|nr:HAMP domain-containing histidine kinase [Myxococcales bacterium]
MIPLRRAWSKHGMRSIRRRSSPAVERWVRSSTHPARETSGVPGRARGGGMGGYLACDGPHGRERTCGRPRHLYGGPAAVDHGRGDGRGGLLHLLPELGSRRRRWHGRPAQHGAGDDGEGAGRAPDLDPARARDADHERDVRRRSPSPDRGGPLRRRPRLPLTRLYALNREGDLAHLVASSGWSDYVGPAMPQSVRVEEGAFAARWPLYEALRSRAPVELAGLKTRFGPLPQGTWSERPESAFVLPINAAGLPKPRAFSVTCLSPHRKFDPRYERFLQATAGELAAAMTQARIVEDAAVRARELAELDRAKTLFFSNISHELRTPLTLILGPLEELMANKAEPLDTHALLPIHRNALRLLKRVNDLLDLARFEAGRHEIHKVPTDLAGLTSNLASTFRSLVESAGLQFVVHCEAIKELVLVDRRMWEKIVLNLFT